MILELPLADAVGKGATIRMLEKGGFIGMLDETPALSKL
jgi:hypothetical protein